MRLICEKSSHDRDIIRNQADVIDSDFQSYSSPNGLMMPSNLIINLALHQVG
jgi:hypothetical protein